MYEFDAKTVLSDIFVGLAVSGLMILPSVVMLLFVTLFCSGFTVSEIFTAFS